MKTLVFNGCSYVAGDAIVWDNYCKEVLNQNLDWKAPDNLYGGQYKSDYIRYRTNYSLAAQCASMCDANWVDLSLDGASNAYITLSTINYLMSLPEIDRKNMHVCVGWSEFTRRLKWNSETRCFDNLNVHAINSPLRKIHVPFIKASMIGGDPFDHYIDIISNVLLLTNFLILHNISYTMWSSLGYFPAIRSEPGFEHGFTRMFNVNHICENNWIKFDDTKHALLGKSWANVLVVDDQISQTNKHPNMAAAKDFAKRIANTIMS